MHSPRTTGFTVLAVCASCIGQATANTFLRKNDWESADGTRIQLQLLEELEGALGQAHRQATQRRIARLQDALRPTVAALPKDASGNLGHMAVRYVLHRIFVERHAWYVQGLTPSGGAWDEFSPSALLQGKVPDAIFQGRLDNKAFGLHELAVLAATLENLVHEESVRRLRDAYEAQGLAVRGAGISEGELEKTISVYLLMYVLKASASAAVRAAAEEQKIKDTYPTWPDTVEFAREVRGEVFDRFDVNASSVTFDDAVRVVEEFNERYGRWQNRECTAMKHDLVKMELPGTGRVLLKDFYTSGSWQFSESAAYLRQMGALDDSDPARLKVMIPNYLNAPSNCLATSSFYSVCCIDECEALVGHIERTISAPAATPQQIADAVSGLPSATVDAPRELPAPLRDHLDEIASHHARGVADKTLGRGLIPLHGRLFAQFMHHAYPRECGFPHVTGTTRPLTAKEWLKETNATSIKATKEEVQQHVENTEAREQLSQEEEELPWTLEEELFCAPQAYQEPAARGGAAVRSWGRAIVLVVVALSASLTLLHRATTARASVKAEHAKFYV